VETRLQLQEFDALAGDASDLLEHASHMTSTKSKSTADHAPTSGLEDELLFG
jgi:hypothetical protein